MQVLRRSILGFALLFASACRIGSAPAPEQATAEVRDPTVGREIVVCGRRFFAGVPVVLWTSPPGYDASSDQPRFEAAADAAEEPKGLRYQPGRKEKGDAGRVLVDPGSEDVERLREVVDQFVLHYDAAGSSRRCFEILQDRRGLSVHFLLDVDGTIYQTLDLRDQAWHATVANPRSIGIEIANLGAYPPGKGSPLDAAARNAGAERIRGEVQGRELEQLAFTSAQYDSLAKLAAALCAIFPRIEADAPRDERGQVRTSTLSEVERASFHGILGHFHVQSNKEDPGPAFEWERFLAAVRAQL